MSIGRALLNDSSRRGRWEEPLTAKEAVLFVITWIVIHAVIFVISMIAGFVAVQHPVDYAWKVTLVSSILSLPAFVISFFQNKKLDGLTLEYVGGGMLGGLGASILLFFAGLVPRIGFGWTLNENLAIVLVSTISLAAALIFLFHEIKVAKRH